MSLASRSGKGEKMKEEESKYSKIICQQNTTDCFPMLLAEYARQQRTQGNYGVLTDSVRNVLAKNAIIMTISTDGHDDWAEDLRLLRDFSWMHKTLAEIKKTLKNEK